MSFEFPDLPYDYTALEQSIDAQTMEIHYDRHHRTYFNNFVNAVSDSPLADLSLEAILAKAGEHGAAVRNNGGGFYNHIIYWNSMCHGGSGASGELSAAINAEFGSMESLQEKMTQAGITRFGSGFAWLIKQDGRLVVTSTPNQDNPLMDVAEQQGRQHQCDVSSSIHESTVG
ncbi:MAG: superoxide dismutase [Pseudomonadota bacterium]